MAKPYLSTEQWNVLCKDLPERGDFESNATKKQKVFLWDMGLTSQDFLDRISKEQAHYLISGALEIGQSPKRKSCLRTLFKAFLLLVILGIAVNMISIIATELAKAKKKAPEPTPTAQP